MVAEERASEWLSILRTLAGLPYSPVLSGITRVVTHYSNQLKEVS